MKRFLFLTDSHFRDDTPQSRTDDVLKTQFGKLGDIISIVREHNVDVILHGGDFFNTKRPSHHLVVDIINWCKHVSVPVLVVKGNHDITGYNLDSVKNSGLGVLLESGAIDLLDLEIYEKEKIAIKSVHTSLNFDQNYMFPEELKDYVKIIISHNYVIPADSMPWGFIHPKDIKTNADLVLCGHYHVPFDYSTEKTRWVNPGPLCRWKINEKDQRPKVLLVEIDNNHYTLTELYLDSARQGNEVFNVDVVSREKQQVENIQKFVHSLEQTTFQGVEIESVVRKAGMEQNIDNAILDEILLRIKKAREVLK